MLDINLIRNQPDVVRQALVDRYESAAALDEIVALDAQRRNILKQSEQLRGVRNTVSKEISKMKDAGEREAKIAEMRLVGDQVAALEVDLKRVEAQLDALTASLPNVPDPRTPVGPNDEHNVVLRTEGEPRAFDFQPKPHWELGPALGIIDFERGVKLSGSRFYVLNGLGAPLAARADRVDAGPAHAAGLSRGLPPFVVKQQTLFASGQLPKFSDNLYHDAEDDVWMVPTAEVPITNLHGDEILSLEQLPLWYCAYTPCFRREKMNAGSDVRGIKRGHQFDKVEMYKFCAPETSDAELEKMREDAEATCRGLGLTYRVKQLCTGDLGFCARMTYDVEVWAPGCGEWLEVSSVSNCGDFQARRANVKFRRERGGQGRVRAHAERQRPGHAAHGDRGAGELPAGRRQHRRAGGVKSVRGNGRHQGLRIEMNEPVVLIGGFGSHWKDYRLVARHLANVSGRRVFIADIARPTWFWAGLSHYWVLVHRAQRAVQHALRETGASRVILVGHSAGGLIGRAFLADQLERGYHPSFGGHKHVSRLITLGSPLRASDDHRHPGLRRAAWLDREYPGPYYAPEVQYLCVAGKFVEGIADGTPEQRVAFNKYEFISGNGAQWGDGVVPLSMCRLDGVPYLEIDGMGHSPGWGRWYLFDEDSVRRWWGYFEEGDAPAQDFGRMMV